MKYFLRTAYGDSSNFAGSSIHLKFQGLCQGNGAAPAGWAVVSIVIIRAHKRKGFGARFLCLISQIRWHLAGILYVDDCDLLHLDLSREETIEEVHTHGQRSINNWGRLLIGSGGAFKPPKSFYYLIFFRWQKNGRWRYERNEEREDLGLMIPMPKGTSATIEQIPVDEARETLGCLARPDGKGKAALRAMKEKAAGWVARAQESRLQRRDIWFLVDHQMWPSAGYELCCNLGSWTQLESSLRGPYCNI